MNFANMLKGIGGEPELIRSFGALGVLAMIVTPPGFTIWEMVRGHGFDVTAYCLAYSAGIAGVLAGTGGGVALKDRQVAQARAIAATGAPVAVPSPTPRALAEPVHDLPDQTARITPDDPEGG